MIGANKANGLDAESRAMLFEGCNLSQLGVLFHMDHRVLVEKLHGVPPTGKRGNAAIYAIHEVAPYLVKPAYDIEAYIKKMHPNDLPKMLTKEFWAGQRSKQAYLKEERDLWPTSEIIEKVGDLMKLVRQQVLLTNDAVERQVEVTPAQREIIRRISDGMLRDLHQLVEKHFADDSLEVADGGGDEDEL